jgi:protein phosphatase
MNLEKVRIVNPGSVGQPKHGAAMACYALWENGRLSLRSCRYPVGDTVRKICALTVPLQIRNQLAAVLLSGGSIPDKPTGGEDRRRYGRGEQAAI